MSYIGSWHPPLVLTSTQTSKRARTCRSSAVPSCMGTHSPSSKTLSSAFIIPVIFPKGAQNSSEGSSRPNWLVGVCLGR